MKKYFLLAGVAVAIWSLLRRTATGQPVGNKYLTGPKRQNPKSGSPDRPNIEELAERLQHGWAEQHHTQA